MSKVGTEMDENTMSAANEITEAAAVLQRAMKPRGTGKQLAVLKGKNGHELRVAWVHGAKGPYLSVWLWFTDADGVLRPDPRAGVRIVDELVPAFARAVAAALDEAARERGAR
jgi:hypothetical protein